MKCLYPIPVLVNVERMETNVQGNKGIKYWDTKAILVPCRRCPNCMRKIQSEWTLRLKHEFETSNYEGYFNTYTIADEYMNEEFEVKKEDMQRFYKRLRKNLKKKIKYFACGEYGERGERPHYHDILLGVSGDWDRNIIDRSWGYGIVDIKPITPGRIAYVVNYLNKKYNKDTLGYRVPPFTLKSNGLGRTWQEKYIDDILQEKSIYDNGHKKSIPRYYLKRIR